MTPNRRSGQAAVIERQIAEQRAKIAGMTPEYSEERIQGLLTGTSDEAQNMSTLERLALADELTQENEALSAEQAQLSDLNDQRADYHDAVEAARLKDLSNIEKVRALEQKLAQEREKLSKMPFYSAEAMAQIANAKYLSQEEKERRIDEMNEANMAHAEQQQNVEMLAEEKEVASEGAKADAQEELNLQNNSPAKPRSTASLELAAVAAGATPC